MRSQGWRSPLTSLLPPPSSLLPPPLPLPLAQLIFKCWGLAVSLASGWVWWEARGAHLQKGKRNFAAYFSAPKQQFMKKLSRCQNWQLILTFSTHTQKKKFPCDVTGAGVSPNPQGTGLWLNTIRCMLMNEPPTSLQHDCAAFQTDTEVFTFTSTESCS